MNRDHAERVVDLLLQPVEWTPAIAARHVGASIATLTQGEEPPQLYTLKPPSRIIGDPRRISDQPMQVWARYPAFDPVAFVITSVKASGIWNEGQHHRVNVYTSMQAFDPDSTDYLMDQYSADNAFAYVVGTPDFLQAVKRDGLDWVTP